MSRRLLYWLVQLFGWIGYCLLIFSSVYVQDSKGIDAEFIASLSAMGLSGILLTHLQRLLMIRWGWLDMKLAPLVPRLLLSSLFTSSIITFVWVGASFVIQSKDDWLKQEITTSGMVLSIVSMGVVILFWNAIYFTVHLFRKSRKQEISNLSLAASNRESELKNLRSQLNPHFLFNSLNGIRALVDIDPNKAKVSITALSNLLRQSLVMGRQNKVTVESELEIVRNYLDLEKIRFEDRLTVDWEIDDELLNIQIPPFVVQMMVENAVKHGISHLKEGGEVSISVRKEKNEVVLEVRNSGSLRKVTDTAVGIANIRKRLELQYGGAASFRIYEDKGKVIAQIQFDNERIQDGNH